MKRLDGFLKPLLPSNRFATAVIGWLDHDGSITLVNAGHCPPMIVRADGSIEEIDSTGPVIGIVPNARWHSTTLVLNPGELLVLYSDGVIESPSADGRDFGTEGIVGSLPYSKCSPRRRRRDRRCSDEARPDRQAVRRPQCDGDRRVSSGP